MEVDQIHKYDLSAKPEKMEVVDIELLEDGVGDDGLDQITVSFGEEVLKLTVPNNFTQSDILELVERMHKKDHLEDLHFSIRNGRSGKRSDNVDFVIDIYDIDEYIDNGYEKWFQDFRKYIRDKNEKKLVDLMLIVRLEDVKDNDDYTILHFIAKTHCIELASLLLASGCDINFRGFAGKTPLHIAVEYGILHKYIDMVKLFVEAEADVNVEDEDGRTPLHYAASSEDNDADVSINLEIIELLFKAGADINSADENGVTPLHTAIEDESNEIADLLLKLGANIHVTEDDDNTPLHMSIESNNWSLTKRLIEAGTDLYATNSDGDTFLHVAAGVGCLNTMEYFLKNTTLVVYRNSDNLDPLGYHLEEYGEMILSRIETNNTPITVDHDDTIEKLFPNTPDHQVECIKMLLSYGADINATLGDGETPLTIVVGAPWNHSKVLRYLLNRGAHVDFRDKAVAEAICWGGNSKFPWLLLRYAALCDVQNRQDRIKNFDFDYLREEQRVYYQNCKDEIERMKLVKLYGKVNVYKLLVDENIGPYVRNEEVQSAFDACCDSERFPFYIDLLTERFSEELKKQTIIVEAKNNLALIFNADVNSFQVIFDNIVKYMNEEDLKNLSNM